MRYFGVTPILRQKQAYPVSDPDPPSCQRDKPGILLIHERQLYSLIAWRIGYRPWQETEQTPYPKLDKQTNERNKQTNKEAIRQVTITNQTTNQRTNQTINQTNKQSNQQTNKPSNQAVKQPWGEGCFKRKRDEAWFSSNWNQTVPPPQGRKLRRLLGDVDYETPPHPPPAASQMCVSDASHA